MTGPRGWLAAIAVGLAFVFVALTFGCNGSSSPTAPPISSSSPTTVAPTTTSVPAGAGVRYVGSFAETPPLSIDLSLYFTLATSAMRVDLVRPRSVYQVMGTSGYHTADGLLTGNVTGTLDGTLDNGTFTGIVTANGNNGCISERYYSGPVSRSAVNWTPGDRIRTCGTLSFLTSAINAVSTGDSPTTSVTTTTITTTSTTEQTTTTVPGPPTTSTSDSTTISTTTTTSVNPALDARRR